MELSHFNRMVDREIFVGNCMLLWEVAIGELYGSLT